jgi:hypothetical protein
MFGALVRQSGVAQANSAVVGDNGEIRLVGTQNVTLDAGSVTSASGGAQGGNVQLSAPVVVQAGDIHADGNAGGNIQVDAGNFLQSGTLSASGSAGAGGNIAVTAPHVIQTASAVMAADGSGGNGGRISVDASGAADGLLFSSGSYSATGDKGGNITLLGHDILLLGASADASGASGGGTILVGGDLHGANPAVANASTTGVNFSTTLKADATQNGNGGKIVVWSDNNTQFYGTASARGGAQSGNGGSMEISSANNLTMGGFADAGAANGTAGSLLLDPHNIIIDSAGGGGTGTLGSFQLLDPNPVAGNGFGTKVIVLPNQNVVVTAPNDNFVATGAGAVFLYSSTTGSLISALTGSSANDHISSNPTDPITTLPSGNFVVSSPQWNGNEGAVTFVNGTLGLTGAVSAANSLVGSTAGDNVGQRVIDVLSTGNYVVSTPNWSNGTSTAAGAVTFVNGTNGNIAGSASPGGAVSASNSLVGTSPNDQVGSNGLTPLFNGNYLVVSPNWNNGAATQAGAATLVNGTNGNIVATGTPGGTVSAANSLVGSTTLDQVGSGFTLPLGAGAYLVFSPNWNNGAATKAGAVTFGSAAAGVVGPVSATNSLVGSTTLDQVGSFGATILNNGNYLVFSPNWNNGGSVPSAGAITMGTLTAGVSGPVSAANSLVGTSPNDSVGGSGTRVDLGNGNLLIQTPNWTNPANGAINAGAVTLFNDTTAVTGPITPSNSLVGSTNQDFVGNGGIFALPNGNYVVISPNWSNGAALGAGAVTFGNGTTGTFGAVSAANSLVGTTTNDQVGSGFITLLNNSNYVVVSPNWSQPAGIPSVGAVTWVDGTNGNIFGTASPGGTISAANSLTGATANDLVGINGVTALSNGNYVVLSEFWSTPAGVGSVGAVTFVPGTGAAGTVTAANSLVGSSSNDQVGASGIVQLPNGNYVVKSPEWSNTLGAATLVNGTNGNIAGSASPAGTVSAANSLIGANAGDEVGIFVTALSSGNYVVGSPNWGNVATAAESAGAATLVDGTTGNIAGSASPGGVVSAANSLVGTTSGDQVGLLVTPLLNGNYLVVSPQWSNGAATLAGAVTFVNGANGNLAGSASPGGSVSASNSLVGTNINDKVGEFGAIPISAGNYVVISPDWNGGRGAVTFGDGTTGVIGAVSSLNSLVGSTPDTTTTGDHVGSGFIEPLPGGNYLVLSPQWNNGLATQAGAVTWVNGTNGNVFGQSSPGAVVSATNSLVGSTSGDQVGHIDTDCNPPNCAGFKFLPSGDLTLFINTWTNPTTGAANANAVTFINSSTGLAGPVSAANSIVGVAAFDNVGSGGIIPLPNGNFIVASPGAANGALGNAGLVQIVTPNAAGGGSSTPVPANGQILFSDTPGTDVTITPAGITAIANTGTAITLQANNDITLNPNSDIVVSAGGAGGGLTLQAGRSVVLNSSITSDNGPVTIVANERLANGVIDANRDPGAATIAMGAGTTINAGSANISLTLNDGAGLTNPTSGNIVLASLSTTGAIQVQNLGPTNGSGIVSAGAGELITGASVALDVNGAGGGGGIGSAGAPIQVDAVSLAALTQAGGAFIQSPGPMTITSMTASGGGPIDLVAGGPLSESGGTISTAGILATVSSGGTNLTGANNVGSFTASNASGDVVFNNAGALTVLGVNQTGGGNVTLSTSAGSMTVAGPVSAGAGAVTLASVGDLVGSGGVQGTTATLTSSTGAIGSPSVSVAVNTTNLFANAANGIAIDLNASAPAAATISALHNTTAGDVVLNAHGGATFTQQVTNPGGNVTINTFSPLDVQAGITAGNSIFLSTGGGTDSGAANNMSLNGPYTYNTTTGAFEVTIGRGASLQILSGATPLVLTAELFPNPIDITKFTFVPNDPFADPIVAAAYNTTLVNPTTAPPPPADPNKGESDEQKNQRQKIAACR